MVYSRSLVSVAGMVFLDLNWINITIVHTYLLFGVAVTSQVANCGHLCIKSGHCAAAHARTFSLAQKHPF